MFSEKGKLYLKKRLENVLKWVLETGVNISSYEYEQSLEDVKTRIKLLSSEGTVLAQEADTDLESKIGIFQDAETTDESYTDAQINELAQTLLAEEKQPGRTLTLSNVIGIPDVISGVGVFVNIPHLDLNKTFYVDEDTHTFEGEMHTMTLTLNMTAE